MLKELDEVENRKSLELWSLVKHVNDKRAELIAEAFICRSNRHYPGTPEAVIYTWCLKVLGSKMTANHKVFSLNLVSETTTGHRTIGRRGNQIPSNEMVL